MTSMEGTIDGPQEYVYLIFSFNFSFSFASLTHVPTHSHHPDPLLPLDSYCAEYSLRELMEGFVYRGNTVKNNSEQHKERTTG